MIYGMLFYRWNKEAREKTGYSMKEIMEMYKAKYGHLPRPGYEGFAGHTKDGYGSIWLQSRAGSMEVSVRKRRD